MKGHQARIVSSLVLQNIRKTSESDQFHYFISGQPKIVLKSEACAKDKNENLSEMMRHSLTLQNLSKQAEFAELNFSFHEENQILTALAIGPNSRAKIGTCFKIWKIIYILPKNS